MRTLPEHALETFFSGLSDRYQVLVPLRLGDGSRALGPLGAAPLALAGGPLPRKPSEAFFPQADTVFRCDSEGHPQSPPSPDQPLLVAGFTARDLACQRFTDRFFADGFCDDLYFQRRRQALLVGVAGRCGAAGVPLAIAAGDCDLELICLGEDWLLAAYTPIAALLCAKLPEATAEHQRQLASLRQELAAQERPEEALLQRASDLLRQGQVPDEFWREIGARCIACSGCNMVCPTCTCFAVQDLGEGVMVERQRLWDSCQLGGFAREAGGHNPLGDEALRTRRRIRHKLAADPQRWGELGCFLCGRCDSACPTGIGMVAVATEIVQRYGNND
jgi:formate hydrogenlyase subunit 6/NADH:ubiquinone oxidoreductase subunit I